jgi:hypothetical protein
MRYWDLRCRPLAHLSMVPTRPIGSAHTAQRRRDGPEIRHSTSGCRTGVLPGVGRCRLIAKIAGCRRRAAATTRAPPTECCASRQSSASPRSTSGVMVDRPAVQEAVAWITSNRSRTAVHRGQYCRPGGRCCERPPLAPRLLGLCPRSRPCPLLGPRRAPRWSVEASCGVIEGAEVLFIKNNCGFSVFGPQGVVLPGLGTAGDANPGQTEVTISGSTATTNRSVRRFT